MIAGEAWPGSPGYSSVLMRPVVRAALAIAALSALTGPLGARPVAKTIPRAASAERAAPPPGAGAAELSAVCPPGLLPDREACIPFDRAPQRPLPGDALSRETRGLGRDQIPRRDDRPASWDAYRLPVAALAGAPTAGARGGLDVAVREGAAVSGISLADQEGETTVFAVDPLPGGTAVVTLHIVREGAEKREILLVVSPLATLRPGLVAGTMLAGVAAVGEFVASVVLYTHSNRPISVEILAQVRSLSFGTAAAYSVLLILLVLLITVGARWLEGRATQTERTVNAA